jgi:hypothetical protein
MQRQVITHRDVTIEDALIPYSEVLPEKHVIADRQVAPYPYITPQVGISVKRQVTTHRHVTVENALVPYGKLAPKEDVVAYCQVASNPYVAPQVGISV